MATEVKHGPRPKFKATLQRGVYGVTIEGHYTTTPGLTAAGASGWTYESKRPAKRRAELLGMRTAFVHFFIEEYLRHGGTWDQAVEAFMRYPWGKARVRLLKHKSRPIRRASAKPGFWRRLAEGLEDWS